MKFQKLIPALLVVMLTQSAYAVKIADITRLDGGRTNTIVGMGLVLGLKGTGDGGNYRPAMLDLANLLKKFNNQASLPDLTNASNVAIVSVYTTLPQEGVRNGEHLDVHVLSQGAATSLKGGTLFMVSMLGPTGKPYTPHDEQGNALPPIPFATATGGVDLEDPTSPNSGIVKGGAVMEVNLPSKYINRAGQFTLIIDEPHASFMMANALAKMINESNESGETIAVAVDAKNVVVQIPDSERKQPDNFISNVLQLPVRQTAMQARVRINSKTGLMIITGDVEVSPTVITERGLTITTINPPPVPSPRNPQIVNNQAIPFDTSGTGGAKLKDLASAFDQLKVPADERIKIIQELYDTGRLHAKLIIDGQDQ